VILPITIIESRSKGKKRRLHRAAMEKNMRELDMHEIELVSGGGDDQESKAVFVEFVIGLGGVVSWDNENGFDFSPRFGLGAGFGGFWGPGAEGFIDDAHRNHTIAFRGGGAAGNERDGWGAGASGGATVSLGDRASQTPWY
jgi:hypothetical protein